MKLTKNGSISIRVQPSGDEIKPFAFVVVDDDKFENITYMSQKEYDELVGYLIAKRQITQKQIG